MKLIVKGAMRNVPADQLESFESQFAELVSLLKQTNQVPKIWIKSLSDDNYSIHVVLRQAGLSALATDMGIAFLREKSEKLEIPIEFETTVNGSCPLAPHREH